MVKTFLLSVTDNVDCCGAVVVGTSVAAVEDEEAVSCTDGISSVGSNAFEQSAMYVQSLQNGSYTHIQYINFMKQCSTQTFSMNLYNNEVRTKDNIMYCVQASLVLEYRQ